VHYFLTCFLKRQDEQKDANERRLKRNVLAPRHLLFRDFVLSRRQKRIFDAFVAEVLGRPAAPAALAAPAAAALAAIPAAAAAAPAASDGGVVVGHVVFIHPEL
jgi:uncharacterized membrane protein